MCGTQNEQSHNSNAQHTEGILWKNAEGILQEEVATAAQVLGSIPGVRFTHCLLIQNL